MMTNFIDNLDHAHFSALSYNIPCVKSLVMNHHASLRKSKTTEVKSRASVVPLRITGAEKGKRQEIKEHKFNQELSLSHNERIFKAKKHDTL